MPTLSKQYALIDFDPANPASTFKEPTSVDVTLDETRVPYVSATVVMPTNALPFNPDPRQAQYYRLRLQQDFGDLIYNYELTGSYGGSVAAFTAAYAGSTVLRTNLMRNPSFEVDTTFWSSYRSATLSRDTTEKYVGSASLKVVTTPQSNNSGGPIVSVPIGGASKPHIFSAWVKAPAGELMSIYATNNVNSNLTTNFTATGSWQRVSAPTIMSSGNSPIAGIIWSRNTTSSVTFYVDAAMIEQTDQLRDYFDGSLPDGLNLNNNWTGTANASTSTQLTGNLVNCQEITRDYSQPWNIFEPALPLSTVTTAYGGDVSNITAAGLIEIWRMSDFLHSSGTFNPAPSTVFDGVLMLRKATKDYISGETTLELTSKDAILLDSIGYPSDLVFTFTNLRDIINYILADVIGITTQLEPGTANATYSPSYGVKWLPDQTAWDYLNNLVTAANLVLYCDENGKFYLIESAAVTGELELKDDDNITRLTSTIDRNSDQFFDRAIVEYRNTGSLPVYYNFGVSGFPVSKDRYFLIENQTAPGGNPAQAVVNRAVTRGEIYEVEAINNFNARPRQTMTIDVSGEPVKTAIIQTVRFGLPSARMSVDIRDLEEV